MMYLSGMKYLSRIYFLILFFKQQFLVGILCNVFIFVSFKFYFNYLHIIAIFIFQKFKKLHCVISVDETKVFNFLIYEIFAKKALKFWNNCVDQVR